MKKFLLMVLVIMLSVSIVACGGSTGGTTQSSNDSGSSESTDTSSGSESGSVESDLAYIKDNGKMVIGYTVYEPMNYTDDQGEFTGFDTELAKVVCEKMGVEAEFVLINWDTKEVELEGKSIDAIWNGFTLDAEREANMACTAPYVKNAQVVVVKSDYDYTDTSTLIGKTVVAEVGSAGENQIKGDAADENLAQSDYVGKSVQTDCLVEVKAGTADAAVLDMTLAKAMTGEGTDFSDLKIVDELAEEFYGIAFRKGSDTRDEVNNILDELYEDGTLAELAEKYNLELAK